MSDARHRVGERRGLTPGNLRIVRAFCEAFLSDLNDRGRPTMPPLPLVDRVVNDLDEWLGAGSSDLQRGYNLLCRVMNLLPFPILGVTCRMTELTLVERIAYLDDLERSRLGFFAMLVVAMKLPIGTLAYETGQELSMTGFDRESLATPRGAAPISQPFGQVVGGRR